MNKKTTNRQIALHLFASVLLLTGFCASALAQTNIALTATYVDHGGGATTAGSGSPVLTGCGPFPLTACSWGYGPYHYNDNNIPTYPAVGGNPTPPPAPPGPNNNFTYVGSGGWIMFDWPGAVTFDKIVLYKNDRPISSFELQIGGGLVWNTVYTYSNQVNNVVDTILFNTPITVPNGDTLRFNDVQSLPGLNNPSTREIQIWSMPPCTGAVPSPNAMASSITPCFGSIVYLSSLSNNTSSGHTYQWEYSLPSSPTTWVPIPGATKPGYEHQAQGVINFRVVDLCVPSNTTNNSNTVTITPTPPMAYFPFTTTGFYEGFDNTWTTKCATAPWTEDVPGQYWTTSPAFGNASWRRNDQTGHIATPATNKGGWGNTNGGYGASLAGVPASGKSARFHSSGAFVGDPGNLDLYLNLSAAAVTGDKQLYFYMLNNQSGLTSGDSLKILMSLDEGLTWTFLAGFDTTTMNVWRKKSVTIPSNAAKTIIRFQGLKSIASNGTDIQLDSIYIAPPCSGALVGGTVTLPATTLTCAGNEVAMSTNGTTMAGGIIYTWEDSTVGVPFAAVNGGTGSNTQSFITPPIYDTTWFRLKVQCGATGTPAYSNVIRVNIAKEPLYAPIPYAQSFESWISRCNTSSPVGCTSCGSEVPSINWANWPVTGSNSWRRQDQGNFAVWANVNGGNITGFPAPSGNSYARFHSSNVPTGVSGTMDLLVNLSSSTGTKELRFETINTGGNDSLGVSYSADGGANFTPLGTILSDPTGWLAFTYPIPSNSATTIIRFKAYGEFGNTSDIGLDTVTVIPPCSGTPNPGNVSSAVPCSGANFTLALQNSTVAGSLAYQWEESTDGTVWTPVVGATAITHTTSITSNTYYRVVVTCTNTNQSATTAAQFIELAKFYYCYCSSFASSATGADIGNVTVYRLPGGNTALSNGTATPLTTNPNASRIYTDFRGTPNAMPPNGITPIVMYHDSTYSFFVTQINSSTFGAATVSLWIDTNRNGFFDIDEQFLRKNTSLSTNPAQVVGDTVTLTIDTSFIGITGMRVVLESPTNLAMGPCGNYPTGETEDYLVELRAAPCNGPVNPGIAYASDTASCVGYPITLWDTTHEEYRSDIEWRWQYSPDGFSWADVPNSINRDTINEIITGQTYFRLQMLCLNTLDTTFSNVNKVSINPAYACYCNSQADGGTADSSDISSFIFGGTVLSNNGVGPHVKNPTAVRPRTDFTNAGVIEVANDSTYLINIYHILRSNTHADAKITLFIDMNNDLKYNITPTYTELVYTGYTNASQFVLIDSIYIPTHAITGSLTGMRLILNNNTAPNVPSDSACGTYTSGETEDYVVRFKHPTSVKSLGNISTLALYPNPTEGKFNLTFVAKQPVEHATITVSSMTGQKLLTKELAKPGKELTQELDLTAMPRGVYFVELLADNERVVRKVIVK